MGSDLKERKQIEDEKEFLRIIENIKKQAIEETDKKLEERAKTIEEQAKKLEEKDKENAEWKEKYEKLKRLLQDKQS